MEDDVQKLSRKMQDQKPSKEKKTSYYSVGKIERKNKERKKKGAK